MAWAFELSSIASSIGQNKQIFCIGFQGFLSWLLQKEKISKILQVTRNLFMVSE